MHVSLTYMIPTGNINQVNECRGYSNNNLLVNLLMDVSLTFMISTGNINQVNEC